MVRRLVAIGNLDGVGVVALPAEPDAPLVVDADAVLAGSASGDSLEMVAGWDAKVGECLGGVEDDQLPEAAVLEVGWPAPDGVPFDVLLGVAVPEALDHVR
jgi:hypothetical protein